MKISLIEFSVENFRTFQKKVTFAMFGRKNEPKTFDVGGENLLRTSLIYGANASGKSSLFHAMKVLTSGIKYSTNNEEGKTPPYEPFGLSDADEVPSFFELVLAIDEKIFRYNFSILKDRVVSENLVEELNGGQKNAYLSRVGQKFVVDYEFKSSADIAEKTRKEVLFLSAAAQWNNAFAMHFTEAVRKINVLSGNNSHSYRSYTAKNIKKDDNFKEKILNYLKRADFCIVDAAIGQKKIDAEIKSEHEDNWKDVPLVIDDIKFAHSKFDSEKNVIGQLMIKFDDESQGTQRFFDLLGPIVDTLENGKVLLVDEFDNSLHPELTRLIIKLFEKENPHNAQLIATTHDTSLLGRKNDFLRSQVWFTEKNRQGAADLFSLEEFDLRNDTEYQKKYLEGRFGALPFIE